MASEKGSEGPPIRKFKTICVFGGSNLGKNREFRKAANELGQALAARNINLVYGGGSLGLRGRVASSTLKGGSKVLGIILKHLAVGKITGYTLGSELKVSSMHERMANMICNADAFIALPGGLGTLEELFTIASWAQLNFHQKPLGLLNINGFYDGLLSFLEHAVEQELISQATRCILVSASTVDQLIDQLQIFAPVPNPLMTQVNWHILDSSKEDELDTTLRL